MKLKRAKEGKNPPTPGFEPGTFVLGTLSTYTDVSSVLTST